MSRIYRFLFTLIVFIAFSAHSLLFGEIEGRATVELEPGTTLYELMDREGGLADTMDEAAVEPFKVAKWKDVAPLLEEFDPKVLKKTMGLFNDGQEGFSELIKQLSARGKSYNLQSLRPAIREILSKDDGALVKDPGKIALSAAKLESLIGLVSRASVATPLEDVADIFHFGYKAGNDDGTEESEFNRTRTKSGRTSIQLDQRLLNDPSDIEFAKGTMKMIALKNPWPVYEVMFDILTTGDASGIKKLPKAGQVALADWYGIYIAEQRRHRMTGWQRMDWENALTEIFMLAGYVNETNKVVDREGNIVKGDLTGFFGVGTNGSGFGGKMGIRRRGYQRDISNAMRKLHPEEYSALAELIGAGKGKDLCSGLMKYINDGKKQDEIKENAPAIKEAAINYLKAMTGSAGEISAMIH